VSIPAASNELGRCASERAPQAVLRQLAAAR
jgi:hypothetical protein